MGYTIMKRSKQRVLLVSKLTDSEDPSPISIVKEAVERYLEALTEDIASGEWIDLPNIGKIQVIQEDANSVLTSSGTDGKHIRRHVKKLLRTKVRLYERFKARYK